MVYQWKSGAHIKADAQKAGEQFEHLASTVGLSPKSVLDANRGKGTPLHDSFEWDDTQAAEKYRLNQAGHFIRCIAIKPVKTDDGKKSEPIRAYFTVENGQYEPLSVIVSEQDKYAVLLKTAFSELNAFQNKYNQLKELAHVFDAITTAQAEVYL